MATLFGGSNIKIIKLKILIIEKKGIRKEIELFLFYQKRISIKIFKDQNFENMTINGEKYIQYSIYEIKILRTKKLFYLK